VAIIGMGCMFPGAADLAGFWANIRNRRDAITDVPESHWRTEDYFDADPKSPDRTYARRGGFIPPVDFPLLDFGIAPNNLEATDTTQLLGLLVARQALEDAGYGEGSVRPIDRERVSVILGVTGTLELVIPLGARLGHPIWRRALEASGVPEDTAEEVVRRIADSYVGWQENSFPGLLGNVAAGRIANRLDLGGTNCVIDAACASSIGALNLSMLELGARRCDLALSGGLDTFNDIFMYMCFSKTPALSPQGDARPFDAAGDGTVLGEGLGVLALKRLDDARRDGDRIYAVIRAVGTSSDGKGNAVYAPSAQGQAKALRQAYRLANISPATIELVEAHGTGTKVGDATELSALNEVYKNAEAVETWCALGSVKSQIGHTKAAAGAAGVIKAALALYHKVLPPTIKVTAPIEGVGQGSSPFYLNTEARPWLPRPNHLRRAGVSAFGFGGSNFHCVLEEAERAKPLIDWDGETQILPFSAQSRAELAAALDVWPRRSAWTDVRDDARRCRASFRPEDAYRIILVANRESDLPALLKDARAVLDGAAPVRIRTDIFDGSGPRPGKLAMLFPGQGSQYPGMLRALACVFPQMQAALADANALDGEAAIRLSDRIYPYPAFTDDERQRQEAVLRATDVAQPAIGAVSLGLYQVLEHFGVRPDVTAGHSFGELAALCAAGWIDAAVFARVARERGRLMASVARSNSGAMLAVLGPIGLVEEAIRAERLELVVANKNAPKQAVLSGRIEEVARAEQVFEGLKIGTRRLEVSAAFHSPALSQASEPFLEILRQVALTPTETPVFANTTAAPYPQDAEQARILLARQVAQPVEFVAEVEAMQRASVGTFLEVGPGGTLTSLVRSITAGSTPVPHTIALDASRGRRGDLEELAAALAELAALGYPVALDRWDEPVAGSIQTQPTRKPGLTVRLSGANLAPKPPSAADQKRSPEKTTLFPSTPQRSASSSPGMASPSPHLALSMDHHRVPATTNGDPTTARNGKRTEPKPSPITNGSPTTRLVSIGSGDPELVAQALRDVQENLIALQRLGEQTAELHRKFLEGQDKAQRTFQGLVDQHQRMTLATLGLEGHTPPNSSWLPKAAAQTRRVGPEPPNPRIMTPPEQPASALAPAPDSTATGGESSRARTVLLEVVSDKTGYPIDMLALDMRLDADLGIDSIKRVEILSALQERLPDAPEIAPEHLGSLQTLREIALFLEQDDGSHVTPGASSQIEASSIEAVLLAVVSEKTGYPIEMLEAEMRLDADLGIDSIKRVEILSAVQERIPAAPVIEPEHLGTLNTLREIALFLGMGERRTPLRSATGASPQAIEGVLLAIVSDKTGYPVEMLEPGMRLDADLGIDSIKRVEILSALQEQLPDAPEITPDHAGVLLTLRDLVEFLAGVPVGELISTPSATEAEPAANVPPQELQRLVVESVQLDEPAPAKGAIRMQGVFWVLDDGAGLANSLVGHLTAQGAQARLINGEEVGSLTAPDRLAALVLVGSAALTPLNDRRVKDAFRLLRAAGPNLRTAGRETGALLVTVSRLDGSFGTHALSGSVDPQSSALAGLVKTAVLEWPEVRCKAIDLDPELGSTDEAAKLVLDEMCRPDGIETGLSKRGRVTLGLRPERLVPSNRSAPIRPGDLVVVSGGARGVTAEVAVALAAAFQPTLVLLGRSPAPSPEPDWLAPLQLEAEIKRALASRANGEATPKRLGERFQAVTAGRAIAETLGRIESLGSQVLYHQVDVRDANAVRGIVEQARDRFGPVRGLIHGAGVLADRRIEDLTDEQFAAVYDTKVMGLHSLLGAMDEDALRLLVLFSSSTARFGRAGQVAYAAANEVLNKMAQREARLRPDCRVLSVNWGPWDGGMVTPSLKPLFASEGIGLIPIGAGARYLVDEIGSGNRLGEPAEVVVLGAGVVPDRPGTASGKAVRVEAAAAPSLTTVFERPLDAGALPILRSHVIDGRGVLPMALILEWLAQGALHRNPGLAFLGLDELRLLKGAVAHDDQPETLAVLVGKAARTRGVFQVDAELRGIRNDRHAVTHARAKAVLAEEASRAEGVALADVAELRFPTYERSIRSIYHDVLFHGPELQGVERIIGLGASGFAALARTGSAPSTWIKRPLRQGWLTDPLALDSAFQLMTLWSYEQTGAPSLPTRVGCYRQYRRAFPTPRVTIVARVSCPTPNRELADIEFLDEQGALVARIEGYECVSVSSLIQSFRRNRLPRAQAIEGVR
jgi:acyl transferase domain-containing protein/NAD(P)-dependent dehydrogenase (short-subunit alcohol dehydrogenase family)/acyl carrier protein